MRWPRKVRFPRRYLLCTTTGEPLARRHLGAMLVCVVWASGAWGAEPARPTTTRLSVPEAGFWPTKRMVGFVLDRSLEAVAERYRLDEQQQTLLREQLRERVPDFLHRNRARLQPFVNHMMELRVLGEEPQPKAIAKLSRRLKPVIEDFRRTLKETDQAFRVHLRPGQLRTWQRDVVGFYGALAAAETQVARWERGLAQPSDWPLSAMIPKKGDEAADAEGGSAAGGTPAGFRDIFSLARPKSRSSAKAGASGVEVALDRWEGYVDRFIRKHDLGEAQAHQAKAILRDVKSRAEQHQKQNHDVYRRIRTHMKGADADRKAELKAQLADLNAPLQDLFNEMTARLESILPSRQR